MGFNAKMLVDSVNPDGGRLTTMELQYPRMIHSEFMTHRAFSRNSASSRAIPVEKMLKNITEDPFVPLYWGKAQSGMQAEHELDSHEKAMCRTVWLFARDQAVASARELLKLGLHKQICNRVTEPWMWITVIASSTEVGWENFFKLRCHTEAEPHMQEIAYLTRDCYDASTPQPLEWGDWHLPLLGFPGDEQLSLEDHVKVVVGRCARVSYLTHDGLRDPLKDIELHDRMMQSGHWSPFEHVAQARDELRPALGGNFGAGWYQYRKKFPTEVCRKSPREPRKLSG